jgi:uncharacterized membrane protein
VTAARTTSQRSLVYTLTGLLGLMGLAMAIAFKDPCAEIVDPMARAMCKPKLADRMPTMLVVASMLGVQVAMAMFYELRQHLRVYGLGAVGAGLAVVGVLIFTAGMAIPLALACLLGGCILVACAVGVHRGNRAAWAIATSLSSVLALVFFFGSARVQSAFDIPLALAVLPSMAVFLPLSVALTLTPPPPAKTV